MTLISQPENAAISRTEIQCFADKMYFGSKRYSRVPCPYIASILASAFTTNLEEGDFYCSGFELEDVVIPANEGCWDEGEWRS